MALEIALASMTFPTGQSIRYEVIDEEAQRRRRRKVASPFSDGLSSVLDATFSALFCSFDISQKKKTFQRLNERSLCTIWLKGLFYVKLFHRQVGNYLHSKWRLFSTAEAEAENKRGRLLRLRFGLVVRFFMQRCFVARGLTTSELGNFVVWGFRLI